MDERQPDAKVRELSTDGPWVLGLVADGPASLSVRRWPLRLVLRNSGELARSIDPLALVEIRLRSPEHGLTLRVQESPPPGPRVRVEPGGELQAPVDLFDWIGEPERLKPGSYRVRVTLQVEGGRLVSQPLGCVLGD